VIQFIQIDKWTKIGVNVEMCLGNNQGNFQLHSSPQIKSNQMWIYIAHCQKISKVKISQTVGGATVWLTP